MFRKQTTAVKACSTVATIVSPRAVVLFGGLKLTWAGPRLLHVDTVHAFFHFIGQQNASLPSADPSDSSAYTNSLVSQALEYKSNDSPAGAPNAKGKIIRKSCRLAKKPMSHNENHGTCQTQKKCRVGEIWQARIENNNSTQFSWHDPTVVLLLHAKL